MNCLYCGKPVSSGPKDIRGIPLTPEALHLSCVGEWREDLERAARELQWAPANVVTVPKYAPLSAYTKED